MNFLTGLVLFFGLIMATIQVAPVVGDHYRAKEAQARAVEFKAAQHERTVKACAEGKTNYYMYDGVHCKIQ
ncbi:hypothetical protein D3C75_596970 [compost metagenome]